MISKTTINKLIAALKKEMTEVNKETQKVIREIKDTPKILNNQNDRKI